MKTAFPLQLAASLSIFLVLASCGVNPKGASPAAKHTRFLTSTRVDTTQRVERLPFEHSWRDPKVDITKYKNIVVRPVTTSYLRGENWEESKSVRIPNKRAYLRRTAALASYWNRSLAKSFSSPVCMFYKTSDTGGAGTLILEVALTDVRFDPAAAAAGAPGVTTGSVTNVLTGLPLCAFEARVKDASTGKLISTAADRRGPEITVMGTDDKTFTRPNELICDEWSDQLMKSSNPELFPKVRRSWFSIF